MLKFVAWFFLEVQNRSLFMKYNIQNHYPLHSFKNAKPAQNFRSLAINHACLFFLLSVFRDREDEIPLLFAVLDRRGRLRFVPQLGVVLQRAALWVRMVTCGVHSIVNFKLCYTKHNKP